MCGIAGFINFSQKPQKEILQKMLSQIRYRGPDSYGMYLSTVALGIRRLRIIDLSTGDQPIYNEDKSVVIVFNGELYNYKSLRQELIIKGHRFKTKSDTEVLVHLYEEEGTEMLSKLNGMFAFALWDNRKKWLLLARDQIGIKPLYYSQIGKTFIFGSEPKTILKHPAYKKEINPEILAAYTTFGYIPGPDSIFKNIKKLLPGEYMLISKNKVQKKKYWQLSLNNSSSFSSAKDLLKDAVRLQEQSDVPVGVLLSGGIDSSLVSYFLRQEIGKFHTFSVSFSEKQFNEGNFAAEVAGLLGTIHHNTQFIANNVLNLWDEILPNLDEPLGDPSLFPTFQVCKLARKYVTVALSGDGGDDVFGGYQTYQAHLVGQLLQFLPETLLKKIKSAVEKFPPRDGNFPLTQLLPILLTDIKLSPDMRHLSWMRLLFAGSDQILKNKYKNNQQFAETLQNLTLDSADIVKRIQAIDMQTYLRDDLLVKSDRASMYNSLELRVPFLDIRLVEYAFSQPGKSHLDLFQTKKILRRISADVLPPEIVSRRKKGFGIPLSNWLAGPLRDLVTRELENEYLDEYFEREKLDIITHEHLSGQKDHARKIWNLMVLSKWMQEWLD